MTIYKTIEQLMEARDKGRQAENGKISFDRIDGENFLFLSIKHIPDLHREMKELCEWLEGEIEHDRAASPDDRRHGSYGYQSLQEVLSKLKGKP